MMKKEDYLWDKTGSDPEIEKLENALAVFRYKETAPPEIPAKVLPFTVKKKETPRSFFRFAYAAAACVAFAAVALGVWFQLSNDKAAVAEISAPKIENKIADELDFSQPKVETPKVETSKPLAPTRIVKIKKPVYKYRTTTPRIVRHRETNYELTKEEKYAYEQLMLALSITGSKLRLVTDKIENDGN
jgi:hypothetical protein